MTNTQIARQVTHDEYTSYGQKRRADIAAASYGGDVKKMIAADFEVDLITLQAHCAFRFARIWMEAQ